MARRLVNLVDSQGLLQSNDKIYFTFKQNKFSAIIKSSGLISDTTWKQPNSIEKKIFITRSFESLTDWTETCIQEKLDEYHTRYSAWRRVRHARSGRPMEQIYKEYNRNKLLKSVKKLSVNEYQQLVSLNQEKILYLEKIVEQLNETQDKWSQWFKENHPNEQPPVQTIKEEKKYEEEQQEKKYEETVQPIVLDSPSGTYLVIQRMKETAPNTMTSIQTLGLNGFRKMTEKFIKENQTWNPPSTTETWFDNKIDDINKDPRLIARVVHEFFKKN